jgi:hypothetical protein
MNTEEIESFASPINKLRIMVDEMIELLNKVMIEEDNTQKEWVWN